MSTSLRFSRNEPYLGGACSRLSRNLKALLEARRLSTAELPPPASASQAESSS